MNNKMINNKLQNIDKNSTLLEIITEYVNNEIKILNISSNNKLHIIIINNHMTNTYNHKSELDQLALQLENYLILNEPSYLDNVVKAWYQMSQNDDNKCIISINNKHFHCLDQIISDINTHDNKTINKVIAALPYKNKYEIEKNLKREIYIWIHELDKNHEHRQLLDYYIKKWTDVKQIKAINILSLH
jgi:hypothetical protein